jgi:molecular chaperone DnaK
MVDEAEKYAEEDARRRDEAETRNRADTLVYTTEKFIAENAEKVPADIKSEVETALGDVKKALEGTDLDAIKEATEKAAQVSQKMGTAMYAQAQASASAGSSEGDAAGGADEGPADDDVVEAEIVDEDKPSEEGGSA